MSWLTGKIKPAGPRKLRIEVDIPEGVTAEQASAFISQFFGSDDAEIQGKSRDDMIRSMSSDDTLTMRVPK